MLGLKRILLALAALAVLLLVIGFALPSAFKVERSVEINAPMARVYPLVYDPKAWTRWGVWYRRDPGMTLSYSGPPAGVGAKWSWQSAAEGRGDMEITAAEFDKRIAYKIGFPDYESTATGRLDFAKLSNPEKGVRVTWTAEGDMGANPVKRYVAAVMDRMLGPDFEGCLKNLKEMAERPE